MKLRPLGDKVIVERLESAGKTKGGIVLPDTVKEKPKEGKVIAVGDGKLLDNGTRAKLSVKTGDRIVFASFAGNEIKVEEKEYLIMSEDDILAVLD
ncbi:MAG: co-chaperone GroES [Planctomycetota bacterium]